MDQYNNSLDLSMKRRFVLSGVLLVFVVIGACKQDNTVSPSQLRIVSVSPNVLAVGERDVTVQIVGSDFVSVRTINMGQGINILGFSVPDSSHINLIADVALTATVGLRTVTVSTASGSAQLVDALQIEDNNQRPRASFKVEPKSGNELTEFTFDAGASTDPDGQIKSYSWDFGDGTVKKNPVVKHKFLQAGDFDVQLTVRDDRKAEDTLSKSVHVWDAAKAMQEIDEVCKEFLILFDKIETLSAEEIVVGFSTSSQCQGRQREIDIINNHKPNAGDNRVDILGDTVITELKEENADAYLTARFYGTHKDGEPFDGIATHYFTLVNEEAGWRICNFTVESGSAAVSSILNP